jgi:REP element-mobilizing transposase RayT
LHYHLVFSTKNREAMIRPEIQPRLWEYLGGIVRTEGGFPRAIGGTDDHVHLLVTHHQRTALADFMRVLKTNSSKWVHESFSASAPFWWQNGYGAFTVSYPGLKSVEAYIANQEAHHRQAAFQDEYRALLTDHGVEFDERYLWE